MSLCDLCKSLPLENLPAFPDEKYSRSLSGKERLHVLYLKDYERGKPLELFGVPYHPDLDSLRKAASGGCVLCQAVAKEADGILDELAGPSKYSLDNYVPDWDMVLTKRGEDGGDGLWVLSRSVKNSDRGVPVVASIGFASDEDDPLSIGSSDRVLKEVPDETANNHIVKWQEKCDKHPHCKPKESPLPTRVLDVGTTDDSPVIKLVEPGPGQTGTYVTLSYCWGRTAKHFTTTAETMQARKNGIDFDDLPRTFQDAVTITRMLGVRYLWIDSLCIRQDDLKDWERESAQMKAVYSNSHLTLAADKSLDIDGGLLSARLPRSYFKLRRSDSGPENYILASALPLATDFVHDYHIRMLKEPLSKRAWGFQERVLARRILHFASSQMYWECLEGFEAEEGLKLPYRLPFINDDKELVDYTESFAKRDIQKGSSFGMTSALDKWRRLIWEYGPREMTNPADKLPAISGIARSMSNILGDEYLAGMWRGSLIQDLCWQGLRCKALERGYRAPSWSWASVDGIPGMSIDGEIDEMARILDAGVEVDGDNPFGRVKDGWIKLEGPLIRMELSENKGPVGNMKFRSVNGSGECYAMLDSIDKNYEASAELINSMEVYALILVYSYGYADKPDPEKKSPCAHGLFVTPALDRPGCMRRIGAALEDPGSFGSEETMSSRTKVTLV